MHVHGDNLKQKEISAKKYSDVKSKQLLAKIRKRYDAWRSANEALAGPGITSSRIDRATIEQQVRLFTEYKDFLDHQHFAEHFDSRSNLHSSVLEEFLYYLFYDLVQEFSDSALVGKAHTFKDIFFAAPNFRSMVNNPSARIEKKDHDFVIGVTVNANLKCEGSDIIENHVIQIPAIAVECKTYLDKTMLEGSSSAAEQLKLRSPNSLYIVVAEWLKLTESINLRKFKVDQIYVLRKQKNTDREFRYLPSYVKNPIYSDVVFHLFTLVREHLTSEWGEGGSLGLERGFLL